MSVQPTPSSRSRSAGRTVIGCTVGLFAIVGYGQLAGAAPDQEPAVYWISAQTGSGLSGDMRAMLMGGGSGPSRDLVLQLASRARPAATPSGEHVVPQALRVGPSLPLVAPPVAPKRDGDSPVTRGLPSEMKGRMVIYWGCGETAASGSPRTVDMRNPGAAFTGVTARSMRPPSATSYAGYAEWPNRKSRAELKSASSLTGEHLIRSNFAPEMKFDLSANQDFLAPIKLGQQKNPSGSLALSWPGIDRANGYFLSIMGATADGTAVVWTSSQVPLSTFMIDEFLDPAEVARLVSQKAVMPADARSCTVPAAVMKAIETPLLTMTAYGQETNIGEPKPAAAPASWRPSWLVKVRHRSTTRLMLGEAGEAFSAMQQDQAGGDADDAPKSRKKGGVLRSLGKGLLPGL